MVEVCFEIIKIYGVKFEEVKVYFVKVMVKEIGKFEWEMVMEVGVMMGKIGIFEKVYFECIGNVENLMLVGKVFICYKFYGVVVVFGFYNFLGYFFNGYIVFVFIVGNMVVFKLSDLMFMVV